MISIVDRKQTANGTLKKYVADTYSEMENADDKVAGDIAYCIETKKWYMLSDSLIWTIILNDMSADLTSLWNAINDKQDSLTFDSTPTNDSSNPVTSEGIKSAISTKAPNSHASSGATYGVGTTANYGHNRVINDLTHSSFANGESLSAYQGKVLNDSINTKQNTLTFDTTPTAGSSNPVTSEGIKAAIDSSGVTVDSAMSTTSVNPVQNKVITAYAAPNSHASSGTTYGVGTTENYGHNKVINDLTHSSFANGESLSAYQGKVLNDRIDTKQNKLTFDSIPTAGSSNPVTSEGIKSAIASGGVTVDSAMSTTSVNPVQNKVITAYAAPNSHASSGTTYGVGTTENYGHNKVINDLEHSTFANGESLSAYQGKVLNDRINTKQNILTFDTTPTNNSSNPVTSDGIYKAINKVTPIGYIYIQLANQSSPTDLFGGTWANISGSYAGQFFRAEGGNAAAFGNSQAEGLPNITGSIVSTYEGLFNSRSWYCSGSFSKGSGTLNYAGGDNSGQNPSSISFSAANSNSIYGSSNNVTPVNSTIRIWKKTAN